MLVPRLPLAGAIAGKAVFAEYTLGSNRGYRDSQANCHRIGPVSRFCKGELKVWPHLVSSISLEDEAVDVPFSVASTCRAYKQREVVFI
jgi:hypothetical protein